MILIHPIRFIPERLIPLPDVFTLVELDNKTMSFVELVLKEYVKSEKLLCELILEFTRKIKKFKRSFLESKKMLMITFLILLEKELFPQQYWIFHEMLKELIPKDSYEELYGYIKLIREEKKRNLGFINDKIRIKDFWAKIYEINHANEQFIWKVIQSKIKQTILFS